MDLKAYFRKIRQIEQTISQEFVLVTSLETSDGGKAGAATEVTRESAARLMADGCARLETSEEEKSYQERETAIRQTLERMSGSQISTFEADTRIVKPSVKPKG